MTIIDANHYLNQLLAPAELERIARRSLEIGDLRISSRIAIRLAKT
ncbi:hypothetical protein ACK3YL_19930 [Aeromonas caviae]